jgi:hypothetical protein
MAASSVSRRIGLSISAFQSNDFETALIHYFPALDKTAKKRRPREKGVGNRIKAFISDQEEIITAVATNNILKNINVNGVDFPTAIYKFGRCPIAHEGELDARLQINDKGDFSIGHFWNLPSSYIVGLILGVIVAPENKGEHIESDLAFNLFGNQLKINELWAAEEKIRELILKQFSFQTSFKN